MAYVCFSSEIPVPSLKKSTPWSDVFPDESVKFSCEMKDSSDWIYTWYRDGQEVQADGVVSFDSSRATLSINSASPVHAGQYTCMGSLNGRSVSSRKSSGFNLTVHGEFSFLKVPHFRRRDFIFRSKCFTNAVKVSNQRL